MKALLIFTDNNSIHRIAYHPGVAYIASYLKKYGHEVKCRYIDSKDQYTELLEFVKTYRPNVVGFTSVETQFIYVMEIASLIKEVHSCFVICGGVYVTLSPECVKKARSLDGIIRGEGEYAIVELLDKLEKGEDYRSTKNFCYYDTDKDSVVMNPMHPLIDDLDALPYPEKAFQDYQKVMDSTGYVLFNFTRGCPYRCTYCSNHALARVYDHKSNKIRFRSPESCISEIKYVLDNFDCESTWRRKKTIWILDDLFTFDKKWLYKFLELYKREINKPFMCQTRSNLASKEMFAKLKEANCVRVVMGIESGNEFIRNEIMKRGISDEQMFNSFKWAHEAGLETIGICMIGLPYETKEMIEDTIMVAASTNTASGVNVFYPYSGTELRRICEKNGFLPKDYDQYEIRERRESILNLPTISKDEILFYYENWEKLVWAERPLSFKKIQYYCNTLYRKGLSCGNTLSKKHRMKEAEVDI